MLLSPFDLKDHGPRKNRSPNCSQTMEKNNWRLSI